MTTHSDQPEEVEITGEKLQKVLARAGMGSRREMERAIVAGRVKVGGIVAKLGDRVSENQRIELDDKLVSGGEKEAHRRRVILYNKPEGEICSRNDPEKRRSVYSRLPGLKIGRWISVGRLDFNTSGALLFTNDGDLAHKLMHPSSNIDREYLVRIHGEVDDDMVKRLTEGVLLEDGVAKFTDIRRAKTDSSHEWFYCVVMEGRNREVRRLWESQGVQVNRLKRVRYGNIFIPSHVRAGQWIELGDKEIGDLFETVGMKRPPKEKYSSQLTKLRERHNKRLRSSNKSRRR